MDPFTLIGSIHRYILIGILILSLVHGRAWSMEMNEDEQSDFDVLITPNETTTTVFVGSTESVTFTIIDKREEGEFSVSLEHLNDGFDLSFDYVKEGLGSASWSNLTINVTITGTKMVISEYNIIITNENGEKVVVLTQYVKVKRVPNPIARTIRYVVAIGGMSSVWLIGITTDVAPIFVILRRPFPLIIGVACQFVIMPFNAWALTKLFQIDDAASVGLVLYGTCPGGTNSNLYSVLLDVDVVLSITMTLFSNIMSLGMMPLNLLIYGSSFVAAGEKIRTPFFEIFMQLVLLMVPLTIGIFVGWKWPKVRQFVAKYIKPVGAVTIVSFLLLDLPFNLYIFDSPWKYYILSIIFPITGSVTGFFFAKIIRFSTRKAITIALETGSQNAIVSAVVLTFFYPQPESDLAIRLPYLSLIFTMSEGLTLIGIYTLLKRFYWHGVPYNDDSVDGKNTDSEKSSVDNITPNSTSKAVAGSNSGVVLVSTISRKDDSIGNSNLAFN